MGAAPPDADFRALVARLQDADDVLCAIYAGQLTDRHAPPILPAPPAVPPIAQRSAELDRIIAEYTGDAIAELAAPESSFTAADHAWVRDHAAASLAEIAVGQEATFHVDHVVSQAAGGGTLLENLALECVSCSLRPGPAVPRLSRPPVSSAGRRGSPRRGPRRRRCRRA